MAYSCAPHTCTSGTASTLCIPDCQASPYAFLLQNGCSIIIEPTSARQYLLRQSSAAPPGHNAAEHGRSTVLAGYWAGCHSASPSICRGDSHNGSFWAHFTPRVKARHSHSLGRKPETESSIGLTKAPPPAPCPYDRHNTAYQGCGAGRRE